MLAKQGLVSTISTLYITNIEHSLRNVLMDFEHLSLFVHKGAHSSARLEARYLAEKLRSTAKALDRISKPVAKNRATRIPRR